MEKRVLIARWLGTPEQALPIYDEASVSSARQRVRAVGEALNAPLPLIESAALIASELTHNHLRHAKQGYCLIRPIEREGVRGLEIVAADLGPGIGRRVFPRPGDPRPEGSLGEGLSVVFRQADEVEIDNRLAEGVCVTARKFETSVTSPWEIAVVSRPFPSEIISGDDACVWEVETGFLAAIVDGLGHGPEARQASNAAIDAIGRQRHLSLEEMTEALHAELHHTRGCAMSIARFSRKDRTLECVAAGDIHTHVYRFKDAHFFASIPVVIGGGDVLARRKIRVERITVDPGAILVMFTDGFDSKTTLKGQLDLMRQPAISIAQHLFEKHSRSNDDALVLIARLKG